ncbi:ion transporter [Alteromonas sp. ZYF713]|nr:ion transporter [Alteromonas sp. ZYF713]
MSYQPIRNRIYHILEPHRKGDHLSRIFDLFLIVLILLNTVAVMASTVESLHRQWHPQLYAFEIFSVVVFTLEYVARVWSSTSAPQTASYRQAPYSKSWQQRLRYMFTPMALVDLAAILPFYLSMFIAFDLRILRLLRLTRLIKLGRYSRSVNLLYTVIRKELRVLAAAVSVLVIVMVLAATGMYYIEQHAQPNAFGSIPAALWWAINTLTTVGYGDVTPITPLGKIFSGAITILGVGIFALPAGILASRLSEQLRLRRDTFRKHVMEVIADGSLSPHELSRLNQLRETLGLDDDQANLLIDIAQEYNQQNQHASTYQYCPHCGKSLPAGQATDSHQG